MLVRSNAKDKRNDRDNFGNDAHHTYKWHKTKALYYIIFLYVVSFSLSCRSQMYAMYDGQLGRKIIVCTLNCILKGLISVTAIVHFELILVLVENFLEFFSHNCGVCDYIELACTNGFEQRFHTMWTHECDYLESDTQLEQHLSIGSAERTSFIRNKKECRFQVAIV